MSMVKYTTHQLVLLLYYDQERKLAMSLPV